MSLEPLIAALEASGRKVVRSGNGWKAQCPAHDDGTPSLSLTEPSLVHCHAKCLTIDVLQAVGLGWSDLLDGSSAGLASSARAFLSKAKDKGTWMPGHTEGAPAVPERLLTMDGQPTSRRWRFLDAQGRIIMGVLRWDIDGRKEVRPLTLWLRGGRLGWDLLGAPRPRPIYGLDRLASRKDAPVLVCEGEKSADAAGLLFPDYVAVGWHGGADAVEAQDWTPLKGRRCVFWPDNDAPGKRAMAWLQTLLGGRVVDLPADLPPKWDVADPTSHDVQLILNPPDDLDYETLLAEVLEFSPRFRAETLVELDQREEALSKKLQRPALLARRQSRIYPWGARYLARKLAVAGAAREAWLDTSMPPKQWLAKWEGFIRSGDGR